MEKNRPFFLFYAAAANFMFFIPALHTDAQTMVKDIRPGAGDSNPSGLTDVNGTLYFSVDDGTDGIELWKSDGSAGGTMLVKDIMAGINGSGPSSLTNMNGTLYFTASDAINGIE